MRIAVLLPVLFVSALPARAEEPCAPVKPCEVPQGGGAPAYEAPAELGAEVRQLFDLLACRGPAPAGIDRAALQALCARRPELLEKARAAHARLAARARSQGAQPVPPAVVYPLSNGDLLGALSAYPDARNFTLTSPFAAGPPLLAALRDATRLEAFFAAADDVGEHATRAAALPRLLHALLVSGHEPVGLRYLRVEPGGALRFLGPGEIAASGEKAWASCELVFVRAGDPAGKQRIVRFLDADLTDDGIAGDPGPLAHLRAKGRFAVLVPGSAALGGERYARLRAALEQQGASVVVTPRR